MGGTGNKLERTISLGGALFTLIGYVVGASIFVLVGPLAGDAGPALWLAYVLAAIPALFVCFTSAQMASILPVTGANYVAASRTLSPFWGFMMVWTLIVTTAVGQALLAYGFAEYLQYLLGDINIMLTALAIVAVFGILNYVGVQLSVAIQVIMVVEFIIALLIFGIGGLFTIDRTLMVPLMPNGFAAVMVVAVTAYFSYSGFMIIADMGGEIKKPSRNIPIALAVSLLMVLVMYTLVTVSLVGNMDWRVLGGLEAAVAKTSELFLPQWMAVIISFSALFAAATTIHAVILSSSRQVFALAQDRIWPEIFGKINRFKAPGNAVLFITLVSMVGILIGTSIQNYANVTVLGFMIIQILIGLSVWRIPRLMPENYARAPFKLNRFWRGFFCWGLVAISTVFLVIGIVTSFESTLIYFVCLLVGIGWYFYRKRTLSSKGVDLEMKLSGD
ncbi:MAG: amino acid permease [Firmicutes bacterium]|nr:amino acid permease [Bacillota bacterium]